VRFSQTQQDGSALNFFRV